MAPFATGPRLWQTPLRLPPAVAVWPTRPPTTLKHLQMDFVRPIQWLHGGKGTCQFCGAESNHRALFMPSDRPGRLLLCRDCAQRVRDDVDGFFGRAMKALADPGQLVIRHPPPGERSTFRPTPRGDSGPLSVSTAKRRRGNGTYVPRTFTPVPLAFRPLASGSSAMSQRSTPRRHALERVVRCLIKNRRYQAWLRSEPWWT
jgi:hypothetical protein